jgi:hypothetical protein
MIDPVGGSQQPALDLLRCRQISLDPGSIDCGSVKTSLVVDAAKGGAHFHHQWVVDLP